MLIRPVYLKLALVAVAVAAAVVLLRQDLIADMSKWTQGGLLADHPELLWYAGILYCLCLAIPFMPGVEIGIVMMLLFGRPGVVAAYLATILGLTLAFTMGKTLGLTWIPERWQDLLSRRFGSQSEIRNSGLSGSRAGRVFLRLWGDYVVGKPWLLLAVLLNLPGNWVLGGGGGISLAYGMHRTLSVQQFVGTVAIATAVVPLLVFFGLLQLEPMVQAIVAG